MQTSTNDRVVLAVYGTLKRHYPAHDKFLSKALYIREIRVPGMMLAFPAYPGIIAHQSVPKMHPARACILEKQTYAEAFYMDRMDLDEIDFMEGHPNFFKRIELTDHSVNGLGTYYVYTLDFDKYIKGHQLVVPGGTWLGQHTTVNEMDFGDPGKPTKPKIIGWWSKDTFQKKMGLTSITNPKHFVAMGAVSYDDEFAEAEIILPTEETKHSMSLGVKEA